MRSAVAAGIGMFLGIIALKNAGIVVASQATSVTLGPHDGGGAAAGAARLLHHRALDALKVKGAILIGILAVTVISILLGVSEFGGIMSTPPSIAPTFLQLDLFGALGTGIFHVVLVFVLVEVFDATGTLIGVAKRAGLLTEGPGHTNPQLGRALLVELDRDRRGVAARHLLDHRLRGERLGRAGRRADRADGGDGRRPLPARRSSSRRWPGRSRPSPPRRRCSSSPA